MCSSLAPPCSHGTRTQFCDVDGGLVPHGMYSSQSFNTCSQHCNGSTYRYRGKQQERSQQFNLPNKSLRKNFLDVEESRLLNHHLKEAFPVHGAQHTTHLSSSWNSKSLCQVLDHCQVPGCGLPAFAVGRCSGNCPWESDGDKPWQPEGSKFETLTDLHTLNPDKTSMNSTEVLFEEERRKELSATANAENKFEDKEFILL